MTSLFTPYNIGSLSIPNRIVRSATAERMADAEGRPLPQLIDLYKNLAQGGVGLIITGHMYVHQTGKAHDEMTGIYADHLIPDLAKIANVVHHENGRVVVQINHTGMKASQEAVAEAFAPSAIEAPFLSRPAREITSEEIESVIQSFGNAARRAREAGFDGVQIHGAHGYLISQFLSPFVNCRTDKWGGSIEKRMRFLREVSKSVREKVGAEYPVLIKLGMMDGVDGGLTSDDGAHVVATLEDMGFDAVEISGGISGTKNLNIQKGIRSEADEAYFLPLARQARPVTQLPIILVGGFRSRTVMEQVLNDGYADFISLCRPLISEPDLPNLMKLGLKDKSRCLSANNCWAENPGDGIACKCPHDEVNEKTNA
jgi:2,4-dienoyl-CoA reductase-like NADH-dependent reductase (Old Yellow Enzyme family)